MAIYYFGDHSVTFIKKSGNLVSYRRSWVDWHLVPASRPFVSPAAPNVQIVSIPGSNKTIDLTESLSGSVTFARRSGTWSFIVDHDKWSNWHTAYKEIMSFINGQELYCVLEDDHDTVYHGRLALNEWQNGDNYSQITIGYNFEYGDLENDFSYPLTKSISSISAVYNQKRAITTDSSLDDLRKDLVVTATFDDNTTEEIDYYTLIGSLSTAGTRTITAACGNKTDRFTVNVGVGAVYILKYYNYDGSQLIYSEIVTRGGNGTYAGTPTREADSQYFYSFIGWNIVKNASYARADATKNITANKNVYAAYSRKELGEDVPVDDQGETPLGGG